MEDWLNSILTQISEGTLLPAAYFQHLDCDKALESRDNNGEFDSEWARIFKELERLWSEPTIADPYRKLRENIRRESFLAVSRATGQHEIASYVSDDFDVIVRGKLIGMQNDLLEKLWNSYQRGEFPCPPV